MRLSAIIPNYNGEHLLKKNSPQILKAFKSFDKTNKEFEIVVVDDSSSDDSVKLLKELKNQYSREGISFKFFVNPRNLGFSSSVNRGVREASGEILILLNSDVVPQENFLEPLIENFKDKKIFAVGCMDESIENGEAVNRGRGKGRWIRGFLVHQADVIAKGSSLWVSGGSGAFSKRIWHELGGLDEAYNPFYWEDIDISYRAQKIGYKVLFEPESIVVHEHEKGAIKSKYTANQIKKIAYRNQLIFSWKNSDARNLFENLLWLPLFFIKAIMGGDRVFISGFLMAFKLSPYILSQRRKQKKLSRLTDEEVIRINKNV